MIFIVHLSKFFSCFFSAGHSAIQNINMDEFCIRSGSHIATLFVVLVVDVVVVGATSSKSPQLRRFKSDRDKIQVPVNEYR